LRKANAQAKAQCVRTEQHVVKRAAWSPSIRMLLEMTRCNVAETLELKPDREQSMTIGKDSDDEAGLVEFIDVG
jgi:hypothetical protein